jgi:hypothetical protein
MDSGNFRDVYFGEFITLFKDVYHATDFKNKFLYVIMPPGWNHTGEHQTVKMVRAVYFKSLKITSLILIINFNIMKKLKEILLNKLLWINK